MGVAFWTAAKYQTPRNNDDGWPEVGLMQSFA